MNPRDPRQVIVSYHQAAAEGSDHHFGVPVNAHVAWSADGGATWTVATSTTHERYLRSLDATVTFDRHGHAFLSFLAMDNISLTTRHGQYVRRSLDGGRTWAGLTTLVEHPGGQDPVLEHFPNLLAGHHVRSRYSGNLYVIWDRQLADAKTEMMLGRSTDDGQTWSRPGVISTHPNRLSHTPAVGGDGTVYRMYALFTADATEIMLEASRDGGQTFEPPHHVVRIKPPSAKSWSPAEFPRPGGWPVMAIDPRGAQGRLFVVLGGTTRTGSGIFWPRRPRMAAAPGRRRFVSMTIPSRTAGTRSCSGWPSTRPTGQPMSSSTIVAAIPRTCCRPSPWHAPPTEGPPLSIMPGVSRRRTRSRRVLVTTSG